jgi:predicted MPP superfamily phosphohydrolase
MFHVLMLVVVGVALFRIARAPSFAAMLGAAVAVVALAGIIASPLGEGVFGMIRLFAWGVFFYLPVTLLAAALLFGRRNVRSSLVAIVAALAIIAVAVDAFLIEPKWLEVTHVTLTSPKVKAPIKIAIIADLQTDAITDFERDALARVVAERPDLILFAGDYLQVRGEDAWRTQRDRLNGLLRDLNFQAPLGAFAVGGNIDPPAWPELFAGAGVTVLEATRTVDLARDDVCVTGLSMADSFDRHAAVSPQPRFHIAVGHSPDFALSDKVHADLLVAGHTHGGQVQFPVVGPLITLAKVPRAWAAGVTELTGGRHLVVSRGIGMERGAAPPMRFLCRPELLFVTVEPLTPSP